MPGLERDQCHSLGTGNSQTASKRVGGDWRRRWVAQFDWSQLFAGANLVPTMYNLARCKFD